MCNAASAAVGGLLLAWAIVLAANSAPIHPGASALLHGRLPTPNAANCTVGSCWDAADKYGYGACTSGAHVGLGGTVRGARIERRGTTCYKSIYINLEANSGVCLGIVMVWTVMTSRVWERAMLAIWMGDARWAVVAALAAGTPSWYYSWKLCFVYVNESMHFALRSQVFFTATETFMVCVAAAHVRRSDAVLQRWVSLGAATSIFHLLQLFLDEHDSFGVPMKRTRSLLLAGGDVALLYAFTNLQTFRCDLYRTTAMVAVVAELLVFHMAFADGASWTALR